MKTVIIDCPRCKGTQKDVSPFFASFVGGECPDCENGKVETVVLPIIAVDGKAIYKKREDIYDSRH